jgi:hypothetical protein
MDDLALHDAQAVIAAEHGIASWADLKEARVSRRSWARWSAGVDFQERLRRKPRDWIEFVVRDPDGNLILFGSPA